MNDKGSNRILTGLAVFWTAVFLAAGGGCLLCCGGLAVIAAKAPANGLDVYDAALSELRRVEPDAVITEHKTTEYERGWLIAGDYAAKGKARKFFAITFEKDGRGLKLLRTKIDR